MAPKTNCLLLCVPLLIVNAVSGAAQERDTPARKVPTPAAMKAEIEALKPAKVAWREIVWQSCLLDGLKESRAKNKPVLLWIFIDRPADDARC